MTCIEEDAIIKITPLISIVKLTYGNIGTKGIQYVCGIIPNYPIYYLIYQVNANTLFCLTILKKSYFIAVN